MSVSGSGSGGGGGGGAIIPASRFLRRRAAVRDLGGDASADAFWAAAPLLYDFSQQQEPTPLAVRRPPSPAPTSPCLLLARKPHKERSPSSSPPPPAPRHWPRRVG